MPNGKTRSFFVAETPCYHGGSKDPQRRQGVSVENSVPYPAPVVNLFPSYAVYYTIAPSATEGVTVPPGEICANSDGRVGRLVPTTPTVGVALL